MADKFNINTPGAFEQLFKEHYPSAVLFARKYVNDIDAARDLAQQVFVNLYEKRASLNINTSVKSYLFTAIRNTALNKISQKQTHQKHHDTIKLGLSSSYEPHDQVVYNELEEKIHGIVNQLPDKCRQIFKMNRFDGKKNKEIAEELNISIRTVETQISKALKSLRKNLPRELLILLIYSLFF